MLGRTQHSCPGSTNQCRIPALDLQINAKQNPAFLPRIFRSMPSRALHSCPGSSNQRQAEHRIPAPDLQINAKKNTAFLPRIYKSTPRRTLHSCPGSSNQCEEEQKLQTLVYDIIPSTTAVFSYAIGSRKLSANEQFFVGAQTLVSLLQTTQSISDVCGFICAGVNFVGCYN